MLSKKIIAVKRKKYKVTTSNFLLHHTQSSPNLHSNKKLDVVIVVGYELVEEKKAQNSSSYIKAVTSEKWGPKKVLPDPDGMLAVPFSLKTFNALLEIDVSILERSLDFLLIAQKDQIVTVIQNLQDVSEGTNEQYFSILFESLFNQQNPLISSYNLVVDALLNSTLDLLENRDPKHQKTGSLAILDKIFVGFLKGSNYPLYSTTLDRLLNIIKRTQSENDALFSILAAFNRVPETSKPHLKRVLFTYFKEHFKTLTDSEFNDLQEYFEG